MALVFLKGDYRLKYLVKQNYFEEIQAGSSKSVRNQVIRTFSSWA